MTPQNAAFHLGLFCLLTGISSKNEIKMKITPNAPKNESGLAHLITMGKSTCGLSPLSVMILEFLLQDAIRVAVGAIQCISFQTPFTHIEVNLMSAPGRMERREVISILAGLILMYMHVYIICLANGINKHLTI